MLVLFLVFCVCFLSSSSCRRSRRRRGARARAAVAMARVEAGVPDGEERVPVVGATRRGAGTRRRCGAAKSLLALPSDAIQPTARVVLTQHEAGYRLRPARARVYPGSRPDRTVRARARRRARRPPGAGAEAHCRTLYPPEPVDTLRIRRCLLQPPSPAAWD